MSESHPPDDPSQHLATWEERARFWESEFASFLTNLPDAVYTQDLEGNLICVNPAGERLSGFARADLVGTNVRRLLTPGSWATLAELARNAIEGRGPASGQAELVTRSGQLAPVEVDVLIRRDQGRPVGMQYVARDIGGRKRTE